MPAGYVPLLEFDRDAWVFGANFWPDPDVAVKVDYTVVRNQSSVISAPNSFNMVWDGGSDAHHQTARARDGDCRCSPRGDPAHRGIRAGGPRNATIEIAAERFTFTPSEIRVERDAPRDPPGER